MKLHLFWSDVPNGRAIGLALFDTPMRINIPKTSGLPELHLMQNNRRYFLHLLMNRNHYFLRFDDGVKAN